MRFSSRWHVVAVIVCIVATSMAMAQATEPETKTISGLALFLTWLPMLMFLGFFVFVMRRISVPAKRIHAHMDKVEGLLERLVKATEGRNRNC